MEDACLETALHHHNQLRSMASTKTQRSDPIIDLLGSRSLPVVDQPSTDRETEYKYLKDIVHWLGIISDTTRSLTRCRPSILLPGRIGEKKVWSAVRQHTDIFLKEFQTLIDVRAPLSDSKVSSISQHAFAFRTLVWAAITHVQDAVSHQTSDITLSEAVENVRKESNHFEQVFGLLLSRCQRDFLLLSRATQLSYSK